MFYRRQLLGESCRRPLRLLLLPQEADDRRGQVLLFGVRYIFAIYPEIQVILVGGYD